MTGHVPIKEKQMDLNETVETLRDVFETHMMWEYPQIDVITRKNLAYELALVGTAVL